MEVLYGKYEINKYLATFSEQVDDLYQSLNIESLIMNYLY